MNFIQHQLQLEKSWHALRGLYLLLPFEAESISWSNFIKDGAKSSKIEQNRGCNAPKRYVEGGILNADHQESCTVCGAQTYPNLSSNAHTADYIWFFLHWNPRFSTEVNIYGHTRITEIAISSDPDEILPPAWKSGIPPILVWPYILTSVEKSAEKIKARTGRKFFPPNSVDIIAHGGRLFDPNLSPNATLLTKIWIPKGQILSISIKNRSEKGGSPRPQGLICYNWAKNLQRKRIFRDLWKYILIEESPSFEFYTAPTSTGKKLTCVARTLSVASLRSWVDFLIKFY